MISEQEKGRKGGKGREEMSLTCPNLELTTVTNVIIHVSPALGRKDVGISLDFLKHGPITANWLLIPPSRGSRAGKRAGRSDRGDRNQASRGWIGKRVTPPTASRATRASIGVVSPSSRLVPVDSRPVNGREGSDRGTRGSDGGILKLFIS
jgi:hypothetical protein